MGEDGGPTSGRLTVESRSSMGDVCKNGIVLSVCLLNDMGIVGDAEQCCVLLRFRNNGTQNKYGN